MSLALRMADLTMNSLKNLYKGLCLLHGSLISTDNQQITMQAGDIVLYSGNQIVMFYGSNSWDYTKIGRIDDLSGWEDALGTDSVTAVFSIVK